MHYKLSSQWTLYGIATVVSYQGGFMDSGIEEFHDIFGFSDFGRPAVARNSTNIILDLKGAQATMLDVPETQGFTDPIFGLRYSGISLPGRWEMSMEAAVKVPLEGERMFLSTGRTDYGMQASFRHLGERNAFHVDLVRGVLRGRRHPRAARVADHSHLYPGLGTSTHRQDQPQPAGLHEQERVHRGRDRTRRTA